MLVPPGESFPPSSGQDVAPLAAPDHEGDHGQGEENRDEDEDGERVVGRVHKHHLSVGAVGEKVLVDADDVALHQWVGPVAVHEPGLIFCALREEVVLAEDRRTIMRGNAAATCGLIYLQASCSRGNIRSTTPESPSLEGEKQPFHFFW